MKVYILVFIFLGLMTSSLAQGRQIDELISPEELCNSELYLEVIRLCRGGESKEERFLYARALHEASFSQEALKELTNIKKRIIDKKDDFYRKVWLHEIEVLVTCHMYAQAFEEYKDYIKEHPIPHQIFYKLARYYHSDIDKLKKLYELTLTDKEASYINAHLYFSLGMIYYTKKDYKRAITYLKKAQTFSNYLPTATTAAVILYLVDTYIQERDYDNAHSLLLDVLSDNSQKAVIEGVKDKLVFLLGFLEVQRGNYRSALEYLLSVKNSEIVSEDKLKYLIGYLYLQLFDFISAIKYLQEAYILTEGQLKEKILIYIFLAQIQLGYLELAEKTLSLIQNDNKITYYFLLADSFYQRLDFANAVKYYKMLSKEPRAKFMSAICYLYLGMKEKTIDILLELSKHPKDYLQYLACYWLGHIYYKELDFSQAYKYFKLASSSPDLMPSAFYYAGCSSFNLKDYNLAIENFSKSSLTRAQYWIATIYYKKGKLEEAKNIYNKLLQRLELEKDEEYKALVLYYLGFCYFKEGRYLTSCKYFKRIIDEYKDKEYKNIHERAIYMLGDCYYNLGDYQEARNYYSLLGTDEALYKIGYSYYLEGKISEAVDIFNSRDIASFRKKLGSIYEEKGEFSLAAKEYEKLAKILPKDPTPRLNQGRCLMAIKEYKSAISVLQEAKNLTDDKDLIADIQFKIALCYYHMKDYKDAYREFKSLQRQAYKLDREDLIQEAEFYLEDIKNYL